MHCKYCGMESATTDQCSWCHHSFSSAASGAEAPDSTVAESPDAAPQSGAAPVPNARAELAETAEEPPPAPWTLAPPEPVAESRPEPTPPVGKVPVNGSGRPAIGVKRPLGPNPGVRRTTPTAPPARAAASPAASGQAGTAKPSGPPAVGVNRAGGTAHTPAPPIPAGRHTPQPVNRPLPRPLNSPPLAAPVQQVSPAPAPQTAAPPPVPLQSQPPMARPPAPPTRMDGTAPAVSPPPTAPSMSAPSPAAAPPPRQAPASSVGGYNAAVASQAAREAYVPTMGTFQPVKSKYYTDQVIDPVSGTHYDTNTGVPTTAGPVKTARKEPDVVLHWDDEKPRNTPRLGQYLGAFALLLVLAGAAAFLLPQSYAVPMAISQFLGALLLPVFKVVPWADEDSDHTFLFILLTLAFGPFVSLVIYGFYALLRQDANPAIVGVFSVAALSRLVCEMAAGGLAPVMPFGQAAPSLAILALNWSGLVALAGWYCASVFHKLDE